MTADAFQVNQMKTLETEYISHPLFLLFNELFCSLIQFGQ